MDREIGKMLYKLLLLLGLLSAAQCNHHQVRHGQKISQLSGDALIQAACSGVGDDISDCISTLQSAPPEHKSDANAITLFILKFVENHAENITQGIKKMGEVGPLLQSALTDCMDQYNSLDDLIEDATLAVQSKNYEDAQKFVMASLSGLDVCDSGLRASEFEEKAENKTGSDFQMATGLYTYNHLHRKLLFAALNILSVRE